MKQSCSGIDRYGKQCRNYQANSDTKFCIYHAYMEIYTEEQMQNLSLCSGCKKMYYLPSEGGKRCQNCLQRSRKVNKQVSDENAEIRATMVPCSRPNCQWFCIGDTNYCKKHQIWIFCDETEAKGLRCCVNYIRGCRAQLEPSYTFTRCQECLKKDREKDHKRRNGAIERREELGTITEEIQCTVCCKLQPREEFLGERDTNMITKQCKTCREKNKIQDAKRRKLDEMREVTKLPHAKLVC